MEILDTGRHTSLFLRKVTAERRGSPRGPRIAAVSLQHQDSSVGFDRSATFGAEHPADTLDIENPVVVATLRKATIGTAAVALEKLVLDLKQSEPVWASFGQHTGKRGGPVATYELVRSREEGGLKRVASARLQFATEPGDLEPDMRRRARVIALNLLKRLAEDIAKVRFDPAGRAFLD